MTEREEERGGPVGEAAAETPLAVVEAPALEAEYQKRILRYLVIVGAPFILTYGVVLMLLTAPAYIMGLYLFSVLTIGIGFAVLMRPMPAGRFLQIHRVVSIGYIASLLAVQVLSVAVLNRMEFTAWILLYPSLAVLLMSRTDGPAVIVFSGAAFFLPLFLDVPVALTPESLLVMKVNLVLIFVLVAACTFYIDRTRRSVQQDLVRRQREALQMRQKAEEASSAKSRFLANMSHELRTPLNHIIGFTELLLASASDRKDETSAEYLGDVLSSGRHLLALVNDILDLAQIEEGRLQLALGPARPEDLLKRAARLVVDRGREKQVTVIVSPDVPDRSFRADAVRLTQVLVNLLVNAVKFTPAGGMVTTGCRLIEEPGEGSMMEFWVSDTGIGIPREQVPLLFQRFSRLEQSVHSHPGAGLGLALSRELVERHGGSIRAESEGAGRGATFLFRVPAS